eukprot:2021373-Prymnesium_polylepis.1
MRGRRAVRCACLRKRPRARAFLRPKPARARDRAALRHRTRGACARLSLVPCGSLLQLSLGDGLEEEEGEADDAVGKEQHRALEPVGLTVLRQGDAAPR